VGLAVDSKAVKVMGKPYAGNPHVRFDEGEGGLFNACNWLNRPLLYSTIIVPTKILERGLIKSVQHRTLFRIYRREICCEA